MKVVNIHQAKTQLSKYLTEVAGGKEVIIGKYGVPIAKIVPFHQTKKNRKPGLLKGKIHIPDDFDKPWDEIVAALKSPF